ncbi:hypothetical protein [Nocardioides solisilvae]|uniref:hypothetical protein n=1 Tax=Nocardioides solisilvae TaxID=1542435 RepID=UPI000D742E25|nr:hypothetical protein [Nocardioides solisilvae]
MNEQVPIAGAAFFVVAAFLIVKLAHPIGPRGELSGREKGHVLLAFLLLASLPILAAVLPPTFWGTNIATALGAHYVFVITGSHALGLAAVAHQPVLLRRTMRWAGGLAAGLLFVYAWWAIDDPDFLSPWTGLIGFVAVLLADYLDRAVAKETRPTPQPRAATAHS